MDATTLNPTSSSPPEHRDFTFVNALSAVRSMHPLCQWTGVVCGALLAKYLYDRAYDGSTRQRRYALCFLFGVVLSLVGVALLCPSCEWRMVAARQATMLPPVAVIFHAVRLVRLKHPDSRAIRILTIFVAFGYITVHAFWLRIAPFCSPSL